MARLMFANKISATFDTQATDVSAFDAIGLTSHHYWPFSWLEKPVNLAEIVRISHRQTNLANGGGPGSVIIFEQRISSGEFDDPSVTRIYGLFAMYFNYLLMPENPLCLR